MNEDLLAADGPFQSIDYSNVVNFMNFQSNSQDAQNVVEEQDRRGVDDIMAFHQITGNSQDAQNVVNAYDEPLLHGAGLENIIQFHSNNQIIGNSQDPQNVLNDELIGESVIETVESEHGGVTRNTDSTLIAATH